MYLDRNFGLKLSLSKLRDSLSEITLIFDLVCT